MDGGQVASIGPGLLVLLGVASKDGSAEAHYIAARISRLRIFDDGSGRMNLSVKEAGGSVLLVSQFTLLADTRRGNRPSFTGAASPPVAEKLYLDVAAALKSDGLEVRTGVFGARMQVELVGDGPVTILLRKDPDPENRKPEAASK